MVVYNSASIYISSKCDARAKIKAIDTIIDTLLATALEMAGANTAMFTEYDLDSGQSKVKCMYRSPMEIMNAVTTMQTIKEHYVNEINGRVMHLIDGKNFRPHNGRF